MESGWVINFKNGNKVILSETVYNNYRRMGAHMKKKIPEFFTDINGSERYQISNYGNIRRKLKNGTFKNIKVYCRKSKWMAVKVDWYGKYGEYHVHQIVADAFIGPAPEENMVLKHKNGMIRDNYAGNLEWTTREELGRKTGGMSRAIHIEQIDPVTGKVLNWYKSISAAARENYIHKETICMAIRGQLKTAAGYKWRKQNCA